MAQFAKLFEMPYGSQVLVTKTYEPTEDKTPYHLTQTTEILDVVVSAKFSYYKEEACDKAFEDFDQAQAETFFKNIEDQF